MHPLEVASLLYNTGHREAVIAAAILHDTIEDTPTSRGELAVRFGSEVAAIVAALTEDPSIESFDARKEALRGQIAKFDSGDVDDPQGADCEAQENPDRAGNGDRCLGDHQPDHPSWPAGVAHVIESLWVQAGDRVEAAKSDEQHEPSKRDVVVETGV